MRRRRWRWCRAGTRQPRRSLVAGPGCRPAHPGTRPDDHPALARAPGTPREGRPRRTPPSVLRAAGERPVLEANRGDDDPAEEPSERPPFTPDRDRAGEGREVALRVAQVLDRAHDPAF